MRGRSVVELVPQSLGGDVVSGALTINVPPEVGCEINSVAASGSRKPTSAVDAVGAGPGHLLLDGVMGECAIAVVAVLPCLEGGLFARVLVSVCEIAKEVLDEDDVASANVGPVL